MYDHLGYLQSRLIEKLYFYDKACDEGDLEKAKYYKNECESLEKEIKAREKEYGLSD